MSAPARKEIAYKDLHVYPITNYLLSLVQRAMYGIKPARPTKDQVTSGSLSHTHRLRVCTYLICWARIATTSEIGRHTIVIEPLGGVFFGRLT